MAGYAYINPLAGLSHSARYASHHSMVGYAYVNLLAGLTPSHP